MLNRITILVGHFGSGKSEIGVNFAVQLKETETENNVYFVDLDIVKPYFRSRMVRNHLLSTGVRMVIPTGEHIFADLPIVMPEIRGALANEEARVLMDVAGDSDGCRVLSSFHDDIACQPYDLLLVVNTSRPRTEGLAGNHQILREIEMVSRLKATGIIANTHLMDETTPEIILEGFARTMAFSEETGLPVLRVVARKDLAEQLDPDAFPCPIFPIETYIHPPFGYMKRGEGWQPIVV